MTSYSNHLIVRGRSRSVTKAWLEAGPQRFPCALGGTGRRCLKREGDGATPVGRYRLVRVLYRADLAPRPRTALPARPIRRNDGWCDAIQDRNYNRAVALPYPVSAESLWRQDRIYDLIVVLDHNARPRKRGCGSAIFMHVARPGYTPTAGCVALAQPHLLRVLERVRPGTSIVVT